MLPCFGLLMYGIRNGTILSLLMFLVIIFFFWIPIGNDLLQELTLNSYTIVKNKYKR